MLVLSRKQNEAVVVGENVVVRVLQVRGGVVRLGIEAPRSVAIRREELPVKDAESLLTGVGCVTIVEQLAEEGA